MQGSAFAGPIKRRRVHVRREKVLMVKRFHLESEAIKTLVRSMALTLTFNLE